MPHYVVMFPADDEPAWAAGSEADRQRAYDADGVFVGLLEAAGGTVTGGAEIAPSARAWTLQAGRDAIRGPARPGPAQLSGFLLVTCPDEAALLTAAEALTKGHAVVEIRPVVKDD